jgi:hypothetical protein
MSHGLIRCIALLKVLGSDPIAPHLGPEWNRDRDARQASPQEGVTETSSKFLSILLACLAVAILFASVWAGV